MKVYEKCEVDETFKSYQSDLDQLTVLEVVPISVLQDIKSEMLQYREICVDGTPVLASKLDIVQEIIDRKIKENTNG